MTMTGDIPHSILIASSSKKFVDIAKRSLDGFITVDMRKSGSSARNMALERYYDLVLINYPLPDETGEKFAVDITQDSSACVLLVVPQDQFEAVLEGVTDEGVMVLPKPFPKGRMDQAIRFLVAMQNRMHKLKKKTLSVEEKMEEIRIVNKAKFLLVEKKGMSEDEAHRYIGKMAMDGGLTRKSVANRIIKENS